MRVVRLLLVGLAFVLVSLSSAWAALSFPPLSDIVVDQAQLLTPQEEAALKQRLLAYEKSSGHQLVVATVPSLQGTDISDFSNQLFRFWKLGDKVGNDGILILVAPNERQMRIEVGYGLEGDVPDAISKLIIENSMVPRFKQNQYGAGIDAAVSDIILAAGGQKQVIVERVKQQPKTGLFEILMIIIFFVIASIILSRVSSGRGAVIMPGAYRRGGYYGGYGGGGFGGGFGGGGGFSGGGGSSGGGGASGGW